MKKGSISKVAISITTALLLSACGSSSGSSSTATDEIKVVDGYVMGATVTDNNGKTVGTTDANGAVKGNVSTLAYPLHAKGGFIDLNSNGVYDTGVDTKMPDSIEFLTNESSGKIITPLTTLLASGINADDLAKLAGVSVADLYTDPMLRTSVDDLVKANQIAYSVMAANRVDNFKALVNTPSGNSDLPSFGVGSTSSTSSTQTLADIAIQAAPTSSSFINQVNGLDSSYKTQDLETLVKPLKELIAPATTPTVTTPTVTTPTVTTDTNSSTATTADTNTSSATTDTNTTSSTSTTTDTNSSVPNFSNITNPSAAPTATASNDLPSFNGENNTTASSSSTTTTTTTSNGYLPSFGSY